jgi:hypothetical protein
LDDGARWEWQLDDQLLASLTYTQFHRYLVIARLMLVPFAVVGGIYCWRWSTSAYGPAAGWAAWTMWIFSPNLLAWSATICPDIAATSFGVASCYHFRRWIGSSQLGQALAATIAGALAILAKSTWIFLPPLLLLVWLIAPPNGRRSTSFGCLACMGLCLVMIVNLGYGYSTSGQRLGQFCFRSRLLVGSVRCAFGNRFTETCLADLPVPVPADFLLGMDLQRSDFERGKWSYLAGRWRWGSWPHYYVCAALLKVPLGFLTVIAISGTVRLWQLAARLRLSGSPRRKYLDHDDLMLLMPAIGMGIAISSQTGFGHHSRYALPCLPLLFIFGSACFRASASRLRQHIAWAALMCGVATSLMAWPLSHSYFNALGHLAFAHPPLLDSNLDWGEDIFLAARWLQDRPHARPAFYAVVTDDLVRYMPIDWRTARTPLEPGWYIVSRQRILDPRDRFTFLQAHRPVARLGASLCVYRLTDDDLSNRRAQKPP